MPGRKWGGVARRGAGQVNPEKRQDPQAQRGQRGRGRGRQDERRTERTERTERTQRTERREPKELGPPPAWEPEQWIEEPDAEVKPLRAAATKAVRRGGQRPRRTAPADVASDIGTQVPRVLAPKVEQHLMEAAKAFERDRYKDADRQLKQLADQAPDVPAVRELYGLNLYRLGRWRAAANQLEAFRQLTG